MMCRCAGRSNVPRPNCLGADRISPVESFEMTTVTSMAQYAEDLGAAGFASVAPTDLTDDWAPHAAERLVSWRADRPEHARTLGDGAYAAHERFYAVIDRLYASGSLGGVRLTARR